MSFRIEILSRFLITLAVLMWAGSTTAQDLSPRCEAALDSAAGRYSRCLLRADAHFARRGDDARLERRQTRCQERFERKASLALNRYGEDGCASVALVSAIADRTSSCADAVAREAGGTAAASRLFVQSSDGATLADTRLVLTGVHPDTGWFDDRPYREAGRLATHAFVDQWSEGPNSFADDSPNADFTCESGGEVVNVAVILTDPTLSEDRLTLSYTVQDVPLVDQPLLVSQSWSCDGTAHLFIDGAHSRQRGTPTCTPTYDCFRGGFCGHDGMKRGKWKHDTAASTHCRDWTSGSGGEFSAWAGGKHLVRHVTMYAYHHNDGDLLALEYIFGVICGE